MDLGAVQRAPEQFLVGDHAMARVQEQAGEHLVRQRPQLAREIGTGLGGVGQRPAALKLRAGVAGTPVAIGGGLGIGVGRSADAHHRGLESIVGV